MIVNDNITLQSDKRRVWSAPIKEPTSSSSILISMLPRINNLHHNFNSVPTEVLTGYPFFIAHDPRPTRGDDDSKPSPSNPTPTNTVPTNLISTYDIANHYINLLFV